MRWLVAVALCLFLGPAYVLASQERVECKIVVPGPPADCTLAGHFRKGPQMECNRS